LEIIVGHDESSNTDAWKDDAMVKTKLNVKLCRWNIYGCKYNFSAGQDHEDRCAYRPERMEIDTLWRELVNRVTRQNTMNLLAAVGPRARDLKPVEFLPVRPRQSPIQNIPYYMDLSSWWTRGSPDPATVQQSLLPSLRRALGIEQARCLVQQLEATSRHGPEDVVRFLNLPSPPKMLKKLGLQIPEWVRLPLESCLWNITPKYAYTDLHTDRGLDTIAFQVGGRKIWLLYEPEPEVTSEYKVLQRQSAFFEEWARRLQQASTPNGSESASTFLEIAAPTMRRPYIAVTEGQQALYIPAGWKHAVFTIQSGLLGGYSFCTDQHIDQHVNTLLCELHAATRLSDAKDFSARTDHLNPELWADLSGSLAYVLVHLAEVLAMKNSPYVRQAKAHWHRLHQFLQCFVPSLLTKHAVAVKKCLSLTEKQAGKPK
jgi:hypothetical protein